eukprot:CAMPEP_0170559922 /NCGR_PEP_ID=MMETSP0211-20121228/45965_1 /TAXON_ID=311385 /ORGANISM="Pseudokeronopsis sp., Strain OXSARD2" /LENGTH=74 /DNA_ID=CAMNT_0010873563 /DNA_START=148 /DNA_END=372 /DNA_ORIENTATION=-
MTNYFFQKIENYFFKKHHHNINKSTRSTLSASGGQGDSDTKEVENNCSGSPRFSLLDRSNTFNDEEGKEKMEQK